MSFNYHIQHPSEMNLDPSEGQTFRSEITGKVYSSPEALAADERAEMMGRRQMTPEDIAFETLPAEKIRELFNKAVQDEEQKAAVALSQEHSLTFCQLHPDYKDNERNSRQMIHLLRSHGITAPTLEQLEDAYESLKTAGLLELDQEAINRQKLAEVKERASGISTQRAAIARELENEDELYNMPMDELRRKANYGFIR